MFAIEHIKIPLLCGGYWEGMRPNILEPSLT